MYKLWYDFYWKFIRNETKLIYIYLKSNPTTCFNRIKKRNREEEKNINIAYLEDLNHYHELWLNNDNENIIIIDCDEDFENNLDKQEFMIDTIKERVNTILLNRLKLKMNESKTEIKKDI
jgi:deoxyadenosine/deoxycytidine kinase